MPSDRYFLVLGTKTVNKQRRKLLQGAVCVGAAGFAPAVLAKSLTGDTNSAVSGRLVSNIADPVKTLYLSNHSDKAIVIEHVSQLSLNVVSNSIK